MRGVPLTLLALRVAAGGDGCLWAEPLDGVDNWALVSAGAPSARTEVLLDMQTPGITIRPLVEAVPERVERG